MLGKSSVLFASGLKSNKGFLRHTRSPASLWSGVCRVGFVARDVLSLSSCHYLSSSYAHVIFAQKLLLVWLDLVLGMVLWQFGVSAAGEGCSWVESCSSCQVPASAKTPEIFFA